MATNSSRTRDEVDAEMYREIRGLMEEAAEDEDHQPLSSDEEGYVDGLMEGRTAPVAARTPSSASSMPSIPRKESIAAAGGDGFQARLLAAFDCLQPGANPLAPPLDHSGRIGPAFREQARGHSLSEPPPIATHLDGESSDMDEESDAHVGTKRSRKGAGGAQDNEDEDEDEDEEEEEEDIKGEEDGEEEDPREWSRHTASWAEELTDSAESEEEGPGPCKPSSSRSGAGAVASRAAVAKQTASERIAEFGGLSDLQELNDSPMEEDDMDEAGGARGSQRKRGAVGDDNNQARLDSAGATKDSSTKQAADGAGEAKRVRFQEPYVPPGRRGGLAAERIGSGSSDVDGGGVGHAASSRPRNGYKHYSLDSAGGIEGDGGNAAGLVQLRQLIGQSGSTDDRGDTATLQASSDSGGARMMAECVVGAAPARPKQLGHRRTATAAARVGQSPGGQFKVTLGHLAGDEDEEGGSGGP